MTRFIFIFIFILQPLIYFFGFEKNIFNPIILDLLIIFLFAINIFQTRLFPKTSAIYLLIGIFTTIMLFSLNSINNIFFMELKGILLISIGILGSKTKINIDFFYNILIIYSFILITHILLNILGATYDRFALALVSEINYDVALLILPLAFLKSIKYDNKKFIILFCFCFLISILSASRTAILSLILILIYGKINFKVLIKGSIFAYVILSILIFLRGGLLNFVSIDRVLFILEFFEFAKDGFNLILPSQIGEPLYLTSYIDQFTFYVDDMSNRNNVSGVFPFMYHSFILRFIAQFGLFSFLLFVLILLKDLKKLKLFGLIILIYCLTLSFFYIASISCLTFILLRHLQNTNILINKSDIKNAIKKA